MPRVTIEFISPRSAFDEAITPYSGPPERALVDWTGRLLANPIHLPFNHQIIFRLSYKTGKVAYWTLVQWQQGGFSSYEIVQTEIVLAPMKSRC